MVMKLYGAGTPNVQRSVLPLFLAGVEEEVEFVKVNLVTRQNHTPAYKAKQVFGLLPCLEDGDLTMFESRAIAKYFVEKYESQYSGHPLLGKTLKERAAINVWMESEAHNFYPVIAPILRELIMSMVMKRPTNQELISSGLEKLNSVLDVYEAHLAKNKYLAGENYSLADAFHTSYMEKVRTMDLFKGFLDNRPHLGAWITETTSLPAFKKSIQIDWENATKFE